MIKAVPFIKTLKRKKFEEFILSEFDMNMLATVTNDKTDILFDDWRGKDMLNWYRFRNSNDVVLEFYPKGIYVIKDKSNNSRELKQPKTIDAFIIDMDRYDIPIYWNARIDDIFEPQDYLHAGDVRDYYIDLLAKMGKSHELLQ